MKIVLVGASGIIGKAVLAELKQRHDVITASRTSGDIQIDISDTKSILEGLASVGAFDALVSATGSVHFGDFNEMQEEEYQIGIANKLMGQVNLVLIGREFINPNGSFTLTTGILNRDPIRYGSSASMVNGALDAFVKAAAIEMPKGLRINSVSPTVITEAMGKYAPYFRGFAPVSAELAALAYSKSVEGHQTGQVYEVN
ncbi:short chain dehydrogenase [Kiloniella laminariae]|uniref:short chain dehydrogenase n=1 Tax=Kiloniella laminariae TaxID=454162 RepID=UPI000381C0A4|nr:short chain dehydrogenase [Kiloniella laminariae]